MRKKIEFNKQAQAISNSAFVLIGTCIGGIITLFFFHQELNFASLLLPFIFTVAQYFMGRAGLLKQDNNSRLTVRDGEIYLHGLIAALRYKEPLLGRPYIRVTSLTKNGYYRIKVYQSWVTDEEWQLLLRECT
ncbi:hypothetical protein AB4259_14620 [Vibrio amylolyticus]|uniref:hypothetical protein n=1 Tax=Vibrio amylolyticus TaxID=2847292 RepID=UPI003550A91F